MATEKRGGKSVKKSTKKTAGKTPKKVAKKVAKKAAKKTAKKTPKKAAGKKPKGTGESLPALKARVGKIIEELARLYPDATCALNHSNPLELLVATILSAQCTDARVNIVTQELFKKYRRPEDYIEVPAEELEEDIRSTGFFRQKAKSIRGCCAAIVEQHGGRVPATLEEMVELPGVGRKTANVVLGECQGFPAITVDTHVKRLSGRLGLTTETDPDKIEFALREIVPEEDCRLFSHRMIYHGRQVCFARKPDCDACTLSDLCPSAFQV